MRNYLFVVGDGALDVPKKIHQRRQGTVLTVPKVESEKWNYKVNDD